MPDPCLNSVHLQCPRRQQFRAARQVLLNACGGQTIAAQFPFPQSDIQERLSEGHLARNAPITTVRFWLMDQDAVYPLKVGINTVGRAPDCDVVVQDAYVSRRHCAILVHAADCCELHDVASKNGTYLNGNKLAHPTRLRTGDEIRMCDKQFVFLNKLDEDDPGHAVTQVAPED